jgi:hypothetical protein
MLRPKDTQDESPSDREAITTKQTKHEEKMMIA